MSVSAVSCGNQLQSDPVQAQQNQSQKVRSEFQQIGKDLQSGSLTQAQTDLATLTQDMQGPQSAATSSSTQAFLALSQALQSGDLSAAQQAYSTIQQDQQQHAGGVRHHHSHHHHHGSSGSSPTSANGATQSTDAVTSLLNELGQALQSGDLSSAQQDFGTLLQQFATRSGYPASNPTAQPTTGTAVNTIV